MRSRSFRPVGDQRPNRSGEATRVGSTERGSLNGGSSLSRRRSDEIASDLRR
jgi:hypothetical protein